MLACSTLRECRASSLAGRVVSRPYTRRPRSALPQLPVPRDPHRCPGAVQLALRAGAAARAAAARVSSAWAAAFAAVALRANAQHIANGLWATAALGLRAEGRVLEAALRAAALKAPALRCRSVRETRAQFGSLMEGACGGLQWRGWCVQRSSPAALMPSAWQAPSAVLRLLPPPPARVCPTPVGMAHRLYRTKQAV
jgi:hypothetical protein